MSVGDAVEVQRQPHARRGSGRRRGARQEDVQGPAAALGRDGWLADGLVVFILLGKWRFVQHCVPDAAGVSRVLCIFPSQAIFVTKGEKQAPREVTAFNKGHAACRWQGQGRSPLVPVQGLSRNGMRGRGRERGRAREPRASDRGRSWAPRSRALASQMQEPGLFGEGECGAAG